MNFIPIAIFWVLAAICYFGKKHWILYLFFGSMSFGSFAVVPTNLTAGLTFTPTPIVALMIIGRELFNKKGLDFFVYMASDFRKLGLLFWFWIVCIVTTIFMPRLFAGVEVVPVSTGLITMRSGYLEPTKQNISQLMYISISILAVFAFTKLLKNQDDNKHIYKAIVLGGWLVVFTGFLDFISQYVPIKPILEPFKTAAYALASESFVAGGVRRTIGLMPEASAYGGLAISYVSMLFFLIINNDNAQKNYLDKVLFLLLILFTWLSTSSTAYVSLAIFAMVAISTWTFGLFQTGNKQAGNIFLLELSIILIAIISFIILLVAIPSLLDPIIAMFDKMVFQKTSTDSYIERSMWTRVSFESLFHTYGLGVGLGGTRSSNQFVALISNTGIIGGLLYYSFLIMLLLKKSSNKNQNLIMNNIKLIMALLFIPALLAGTSADFGSGLGIFVGLIMSYSSLDYNGKILIT